MSASVLVSGTVCRGDQRGRTIGFPTANLPLARRTPGLKDGVWAGVAVVAGQAHLTTVSVGHRPTFYAADGARLLEAFLLDFSGDLYGYPMVVELWERLRPQRRFADVDSLVEQMGRDVALTRESGRTLLERALHPGSLLASVLADQRQCLSRPGVGSGVHAFGAQPLEHARVVLTPVVGAPAGLRAAVGW